MKKILVTGAAGFIGCHLCRKLCETGTCHITGLDIINSYYDVSLKNDRLEYLGFGKEIREDQFAEKVFHSSLYENFDFIKTDIADRASMHSVFTEGSFDLVIHLAAQAGVRYSIENPQCYIDSNVTGFLNILEECSKTGPGRLVYASSSSIYGSNTGRKLKESDRSDSPVSMYAATKKMNELMAYTYKQLYNLDSVGLRFFTVYGPWGRPDMAYWKFTRDILEKRTIDIYNNGNMKRDFTFIDDIVIPVERIVVEMLGKDTGKSHSRIYNIGRGKPEELGDFVSCIEKKLGIKAKKRYLPMQKGDVEETFADISLLEKEYGYTPSVNLEEGIEIFVKWYREYHNC